MVKNLALENDNKEAWMRWRLQPERELNLYSGNHHKIESTSYQHKNVNYSFFESQMRKGN